jgi:TPR repeat protein
MFKMDLMYESGERVSKSRSKARKWVAKSCGTGSPDANRKLQTAPERANG